MDESGGRNYGNAGNWSDGVPTSTVDADFTLAQTYTVTLSSASAAQGLNVDSGVNAIVTLDTAGYTLPTSLFQPTEGSLTITGGGTVSSSSTADVLDSGSFDLSIQGAGTKLTDASEEFIFNEGSTGSLSITGGGQMVMTGANAGLFVSPVGSTNVTVDGAGSALSSTATATDYAISLYNGTTNVTNGGEITSKTGIALGLADSTQVTNVIGVGSKISAVQNLLVGFTGAGDPHGQGTLNITGGATAGTTGSDQQVLIGDDSGHGTVNVDGAGSQLFGPVTLGNGYEQVYGGNPITGSLGTLNVTNGGTVTDLVNVGVDGGVGVVNVDGKNSLAPRRPTSSPWKSDTVWPTERPRVPLI